MPELHLVLDGNSSSHPFIVRPSQYMVEYPSPLESDTARMEEPRSGERFFCAEIFDNGDDGTVIGASLLRNRETIFDLATSTIAFADADCATLTLQTSRLRGAFAFSPC
mmetsp:Transcript_52998/g.105342  ORF Transcript_52998/g.105342 Transcript_52998/m.105342 type:complete len:109 (-) Transcript_52998:50-376(-)